MIEKPNTEIYHGPTTERIHTWVEQEKYEIACKLSLHRLFTIESAVEIQAVRASKSFNKARFSLSEMPLCDFQATGNISSLSIPGWIRYCRKGLVMVQSIGNPQFGIYPCNHSFIYTTSEPTQIICLTFGQFYRLQYSERIWDGVQPGYRIAHYQEIAPHLIRRYPLGDGSDFATLVGTVDEIKDKLGLE